ncbi:MAG: maleylpyruvate isomerase N-terminal domain-containing protein [Dehalococcoidia bacterium]
MANKQEALAELDAGHEKFRAGISALPDDAYSETWLGEWNLSQVLAHMSGWFNEMTGAMERVDRGERPTPEGVDYSNADDWNARFSAGAAKGRTALTAWEDSFRRYREAAAALGEDKYGTDPEKGRPLIGNRLLQASGIGHFEEHQPQLDEWLKSRA